MLDDTGYYIDSDGFSYVVHTTDAEGYDTSPYINRGEDTIPVSESDITFINWSDAG